jgi:hypothetical protein
MLPFAAMEVRPATGFARCCRALVLHWTTQHAIMAHSNQLAERSFRPSELNIGRVTLVRFEAGVCYKRNGRFVAEPPISKRICVSIRSSRSRRCSSRR